MYENGWGVQATDYAHARSWYEKAATQGNSNAQNYLGLLYLNGVGVQKDDAQARSWFEKAAAQGDSMGRELLRKLKK